MGTTPLLARGRVMGCSATSGRHTAWPKEYGMPMSAMRPACEMSAYRSGVATTARWLAGTSGSSGNAMLPSSLPRNEADHVGNVPEDAVRVVVKAGLEAAHLGDLLATRAHIEGGLGAAL